MSDDVIGASLNLIILSGKLSDESCAVLRAAAQAIDAKNDEIEKVRRARGGASQGTAGAAGPAAGRPRPVGHAEDLRAREGPVSTAASRHGMVL